MAEYATPDRSQSAYNSNPAVIAKKIRALLGEGQLKAAQIMLERALQYHPGDAELIHLQDVISPGSITSVSGNSPNIKAELDWIADHREQYRGKWVALIGKQVIAIEDDAKQLLSKLKDKKTPESPFVHHLI